MGASAPGLSCRVRGASSEQLLSVTRRSRGFATLWTAAHLFFSVSLWPCPCLLCRTLGQGLQPPARWNRMSELHPRGPWLTDGIWPGHSEFKQSPEGANMRPEEGPLL